MNWVVHDVRTVRVLRALPLVEIGVPIADAAQWEKVVSAQVTDCCFVEKCGHRKSLRKQAGCSEALCSFYQFHEPTRAICSGGLDGSVDGYAVLAWAVMAGFVRWYEEPVLRRRDGAQYEEYCRRRAGLDS
jgi:hypothetical protein